MFRHESSRRDWLKGAAAAAMGLGAWALGGCGTRGSMNGTGRAVPARAGSIRVAHLTDVHVQPELAAARGMAGCLHHMQSLKHKPQFILNTGDCVMESLFADRARTQTQWDVWEKVIKNECSLPMESCIGNHDIWGWGKSSGTTGNEHGWGKKWVMDALELAKPYHAFDRGAWRFIMLDSVQPAAEGVWETRLDEEQFAWLESELKATTRPVLIASHVPIMAPSVWLDAGRIGGTPDAPALAVRRCHLDVKRIGQLFARHPNVKLCISGHLHQIDRAAYLGVTYITNPAVCGNWWKGLYRDVFGEMYTLLDLHADGTFDVQYVDYGWTPVAPPATQSASQPATAWRCKRLA